MRARANRAFAPVALVAGCFAALSAAGAGDAGAEPRQKQENVPRVTTTPRTVPVFTPPMAPPDADSVPRTYEATVRRFAAMSPSDSMGNGEFRAAETLLWAGKFDEAVRAFHDFARRYPRNLNVNDALTTMLLVKDARDFEDQPLRLYARARAHRAAGRPDSAAVLLTEAAERYPGAKARHHIRLLLAELARARNDHAAALRWAIAASDTAASNRLAPFALRLAAESSIALGEPPQKALAYYKTILERYPASAVTPEVRARALEIRKKMPQ
ncbi:MAG TPA: tetratricopeptide repeat protein [Candidatus Eisenbacteria bacterium]|nr:tetratricopeptide repeat protein [Candidatus Eisenbacteria bacterium]